jgi:hypothetical protein
MGIGIMDELKIDQSQTDKIAEQWQSKCINE